MASALALSVTCGDSSPKGRALGKTKSFAVLPKPLPLTDFPRSGEDGEAKKGNKVDLRSKDGEGEAAVVAVANPAAPTQTKKQTHERVSAFFGRSSGI